LIYPPFVILRNEESSKTCIVRLQIEEDSSFLRKMNFRFNKMFCPLIAAGASSFVLTQKNQKVKTEKTFCPQGQLPARFSVGLCASLTHPDISSPAAERG